MQSFYPIYNQNNMYSEQMLDHFQNPRNAGEISNPDATAEVENPACGDILRLTLKVSDGHIVAARFKAKGCVASMALAAVWPVLVVELVAVFAWAATVEGRVLASD